MHSAKSLTFCRFQKTSSSSGFNVLDGLSDGSHSYYGTGFLNKQCGMTIENPTNVDFGTWRCSVGTRKLVAANMEEQPPIQALISTTSSVHSETDVGRIAYEHEDTSTIFIRVDHPFTLHCRKDTINLRYCWFLHPNGTQYTPVVGQNETNSHDFWYEGESLQSGDCGITFRRATNDDAGEWTCHMGARNTYGVEIADKINVKVTGALAANRKNITTKIGDTVHLFCHTSNGNKPVEYCRFLSPQFTGIHIHTTITEENAIDGNYYFTPGKDLSQGDCSLTIKSVRQQDIGSWSCAALIIDTIMEASDDIYLSYETE
ncbi:uncharacterized protein LOC113235242 [Hyposmocoma kahamanoa]|uniref:uncharacterized protein LOC113235242 n=1 Tax=Hyposmocoma kahamanoa TaxID=1477025 RepID=UPI000E6D7F6A|nr:uncharacterized protein LOC113235242 [Hyposmocoma kahamanoa]